MSVASPTHLLSETARAADHLRRDRFEVNASYSRDSSRELGPSNEIDHLSSLSAELTPLREVVCLPSSPWSIGGRSES